MMVGVLIIGLNWYNDKITCIIPGAMGIDGGFVSQACWINGLYVYEEIRVHADDIGYFGVPQEIDKNGKLKSGHLCNIHKQKGCTEMTKTFFLQYQYMVFFVACMAALYYAPYILFKVINVDMISLKKTIKDGDSDGIIKNYFNYKINSATKMRTRILLNIVIKMLYVAVNVVAFLLTDSVLVNRYRVYGLEWVKWAKLENNMAYDYMGQRGSPKPGNVLLPSFGLCEVHEAARDIKNVLNNKHKFVCEMSQHVLYQYVFIITWFAMVFGIVVSVVGLVIQLIDHIMTIACFARGGSPAIKIYKKLTLRECEYLEFIRRKNLALYGEVIRKLKDERFGAQTSDGQPLLQK